MNEQGVTRNVVKGSIKQGGQVMDPANTYIPIFRLKTERSIDGPRKNHCGFLSPAMTR